MSPKWVGRSTFRYTTESRLFRACCDTYAFMYTPRTTTFQQPAYKPSPSTATCYSSRRDAIGWG
eukprot:2655314-Prymnesium_polylepis.2